MCSQGFAYIAFWVCLSFPPAWRNKKARDSRKSARRLKNSLYIPYFGMQTITELVTESTGNSKKFDQGSCALSRKRFVLPALNRVFKSRPITPFPPGIILCSTRASAFKVVWCRAAYFCGHYDGYLGKREGGRRKRKIYVAEKHFSRRATHSH